MTDLQTIRQMLQRHGQEQLLRFHDELDAPAQAALLQQIQTIDFDQLDRLVQSHVLNVPPTDVPERIEPAPILPARVTDDEVLRDYERAQQRGEQLLSEGKVAAFVVAGGQGTRLGYEGPKGCFPATPVRKKPLFQIFAEQILAASRRYGSPIPWYIMTSPANDVATRAFFRQKDYYGLDPEDVYFFPQGTMPAIGLDGRILLEEKGQIAMSPNGHGGSLLALRSSGALDDMARRGVETISYFQVDNPLVHVIDPLFLGLHAERNAEMSAKALPKRDPMEKLGNFCMVDGRVRVIEYSDMPEELARQTTDDGRLRFAAGSIAIHILSRGFVERLTADGQSGLPFHRAQKKVPFLDETGRQVQPEEPNAVKLEMFVFDAMPLAGEVVLLETLRDEEFSPIKSATGPDSPATSLHDQIRRAAAWLNEAGIRVPRDADGQVAAAIEISPLLADSAAQLAREIEPDLTIRPEENVYLE